MNVRSNRGTQFTDENGETCAAMSASRHCSARKDEAGGTFAPHPRAARASGAGVGREHRSEEKERSEQKQSRRAPLFVAGAVEGVAIFTRVAKVPDARIGGMALAGLDRDESVATAGKALELDGSKRVLRQQATERQSKSNQTRLHVRTPIFKQAGATATDYATAAPIASSAGKHARAAPHAINMPSPPAEIAQRSDLQPRTDFQSANGRSGRI